MCIRDRPLVDEVINLDAEYRAAIGEGDTLRANRNKLSKQIGMLMARLKRTPARPPKPRRSRSR